jgi:Cu/Ag efflux protein CusF
MTAMKKLVRWLAGMTLMAAVACASKDPPVKRYHVRGQVEAVEGSGEDLRVTIHHERVPGFVGRDGKASDMGSMKMIFGVAAKVPSEQLHAGAKVGFDFEVRWSQTPALLIVGVEELAGDTGLVLGDTM